MIVRLLPFDIGGGLHVRCRVHIVIDDRVIRCLVLHFGRYAIFLRRIIGFGIRFDLRCLAFDEGVRRCLDRVDDRGKSHGCANAGSRKNTRIGIDGAIRCCRDHHVMRCIELRTARDLRRCLTLLHVDCHRACHGSSTRACAADADGQHLVLRRSANLRAADFLPAARKFRPRAAEGGRDRDARTDRRRAAARKDERVRIHRACRFRLEGESCLRRTSRALYVRACHLRADVLLDVRRGAGALHRHGACAAEARRRRAERRFIKCAHTKGGLIPLREDVRVVQKGFCRLIADAAHLVVGDCAADRCRTRSRKPAGNGDFRGAVLGVHRGAVHVLQARPLALACADSRLRRVLPLIDGERTRQRRGAAAADPCRSGNGRAAVFRRDGDFMRRALNGSPEDLRLRRVVHVVESHSEPRAVLPRADLSRDIDVHILRLCLHRRMLRLDVGVFQLGFRRVRRILHADGTCAAEIAAAHSHAARRVDEKRVRGSDIIERIRRDRALFDPRRHRVLQHADGSSARAADAFAAEIRRCGERRRDDLRAALRLRIERDLAFAFGRRILFRILAIRQSCGIESVLCHLLIEGFVEIVCVIGGVIHLFPCARLYIRPVDMRLRIVLDAARSERPVEAKAGLRACGDASPYGGRDLIVVRRRMIDDIACEPVGAARKFRCHRVLQITHGERTARADRQLAPERQRGIDAARDLRVAAVGEIIEVAAESVRIRARNLRRDIIFRLVEGKRARAAEGRCAPFGGSFRQGERERRRCRSAVFLGDVSHVVGIFYRRAFDERMNLLLRDIQSSRPCQRDFRFFGMMFNILRHIFGTQRRRRVRSAVRPAVELRDCTVSRDLVLQLYRTCRILHALRRRRLLPCHSRRAAPCA